MKLNQILFRMERKFGKFAVPNLMNFIVAGMAIVYILDIVAGPAKGVYFSEWIYFDRDLIFHGQIWRIISFIIMPDVGNPIFLIFALYFYWLIGNTLENYWGTFKFNVYYLCGILGTVMAGLITGFSTNYYLNLSLFIAFAMIAPNFQLLLFFFIPIKIKYLAMLDGVFLIATFILGDIQTKVVLLMSVANLLLFFGGDFINIIRRFTVNKYRNHKFDKAKKNFNKTRDR